MNITLGTTYYNNPDDIKNFVKDHYSYVDEIIIVDDGSDDIYSIDKVLEKKDKIRMFKVNQDYGFNSHGCRNLIMKKATNDWVILIDSDRKIVEPHITIPMLRDLKLRRDIRYKFIAHIYRLSNGIHESVNDYLINRDHFFRAGGYDEEIIGIRDGDRQFFKQLQHFGGESTLHFFNIILTRLSTSNYKITNLRSNKDKQYTKKLRNLIHSRVLKPEPNKDILTFDWEEII